MSTQTQKNTCQLSFYAAVNILCNTYESNFANVLVGLDVISSIINGNPTRRDLDIIGRDNLTGLIEAIKAAKTGYSPIWENEQDKKQVIISLKQAPALSELGLRKEQAWSIPLLLSR